MTNDELARAVAWLERITVDYMHKKPDFVDHQVEVGMLLEHAPALLRAAREKDEAERRAETWREVALFANDALHGSLSEARWVEMFNTACATDPTPTPDQESI